VANCVSNVHTMIMKTPEERLIRGKGNFINCTDYDDAIDAMKQYAKEYQDSEVVVQSEQLKAFCEHLNTYKGLEEIRFDFMLVDFIDKDKIKERE